MTNNAVVGRSDLERGTLPVGVGTATSENLMANEIRALLTKYIKNYFVTSWIALAKYSTFLDVTPAIEIRPFEVR